MNLVVTDGFTLNPGDLNWSGLEQLGDLRVYERTPQHQILERCREANIILTNKTPFDAAMLEQLPHLRMISVLATGFNVIDVVAAKRKGITVCNVPAYGTASVAQHTIALLLELTNQVGFHAASVQHGEWTGSADWCYTRKPIIELAGKTLGLVGYGNIGRQTGLIASALGMKILFHTPTERKEANGTWCSLPDLFRTSDVVSLHCPLTSENKGFINRELLKLMKPTAFLINTARGPLINEEDLAQGLKQGWLAGAALDVLSVEPPTAANPLLQAPNCIITPHNAWMSREARKRIMEVTERNIRSFLNGKPLHVV